MGLHQMSDHSLYPSPPHHLQVHGPKRLKALLPRFWQVVFRIQPEESPGQTNPFGLSRSEPSGSLVFIVWLHVKSYLKQAFPPLNHPAVFRGKNPPLSSGTDKLFRKHRFEVEFPEEFKGFLMDRLPHFLTGKPQDLPVFFEGDRKAVFCPAIELRQIV